MRQCICQICICGRHRCEHRTRRKAPFAKDDAPLKGLTEHKERFRPFCGQSRRKPVKPPSAASWKGTEQPVRKSTMRSDYIPWPFQKRAALLRPEFRAPAEGKMEKSTTYGRDFIPKWGERADLAKAATGAGPGIMPGTAPGKMEGSSTYGRAYVPKPVSKREAAAAKGCTLTEFGKPFTGETETRLRYSAPPRTKREPVLPRKGVLKPEGDIECATTHKTDYAPPPFQAPPKPIKKKGKGWSPAVDARFEGETTHAHDYKCPPQQGARIAAVPRQSTQQFEGDFEGVSHYKKDFPPYDVIPRSLPPWHPLQRPYTAPTTRLTDDTTYRRDFEPPPEAEPFRPHPLKHNLTLPSGPMERFTSHMRDFPPKKGVPTKSCKPDTQYRTPEGKFTGQSVTAGDFVPKCSATRSPCTKKKDQLKTGEGQMEDLTTTMEDFRWMCIDCPAAYIKRYGKEALKPTWHFDKTERGHDFFQRRRRKKGGAKVEAEEERDATPNEEEPCTTCECECSKAAEALITTQAVLNVNIEPKEIVN